jgi:hypothetical protein
MTKRVLVLCAAALALAACSVWPVDQDPKGMDYRRSANFVIGALQNYQKAHGAFPGALSELMPTYIAALPDEPDLTYRASNGSLEYRYVPSWPQLRPVWCTSVGNTTEWKCQEHIL